MAFKLLTTTVDISQTEATARSTEMCLQLQEITVTVLVIGTGVLEAGLDLLEMKLSDQVSNRSLSRRLCVTGEIRVQTVQCALESGVLHQSITFRIDRQL